MNEEFLKEAVRGLCMTWDIIGDDVLRSVEADRGENATMTRDEVFEVSMDAGYPVLHDCMTKEMYDQVCGLGKADREKLKYVAFPFAVYGW